MIEWQKVDKLKDIISKMESVLVAYSGGVDSTLVIKIASDVLGDKVLAVTCNSILYPASEIEMAKTTARKLGIRHFIINSNELEIPNFSNNPKNRCYLCKTELFGKLSQIAKQKGLNYILDGSNADDSSDFRPGSQAAKEFGVVSVLAEVGLTKDEVRQLSKELGLPAYNKPSYACLASRFPYNTRITYAALKIIELAEKYIKGLGISQVRVRHYENLCRIEVQKEEMHILLKNHNDVVKRLKKLGYTYVTLDMEGYRTGSMNEEGSRE